MASGNDLQLPPVGEDNICLPLSINAVSRYWSVELPMSEAVSIAKKYPGVGGSILIEGIELAERHGLSCTVAHSDMAELRRLIDAQMPPIVILPGLGSTVQHASVISGYDPEEKTVIHYIPQAGDGGEFQMGVIPEAQFDSMWSEDSRLLIIIAPPEKARQARPEDSMTKSNRLCFLSERQSLLGDKATAAATLRQAVQLHPENSTAHALLGSVLNEQGSKECVGSYQRAIEINPRYYLAYRGLGNYYLKAGCHEQAESHYTQAIGINPSRYGPVYKNRALMRMKAEDHSGAKEDLESYLCLTPGAPDYDSVRQAISEMK